MRLLLFGLVLAACSSSAPGLATPYDATVSGELVSIDLEPMAYDGNAVLVLRTAEGEARVEIPARTNLCRADGLDIALAARPGERLTVTGLQSEAGGVIVPCQHSNHLVRRG